MLRKGTAAARSVMGGPQANNTTAFTLGTPLTEIYVMHGETAAVFRCEADGDYQELARYPADSPDMAKQTPVAGSRSHG